MRGDEGGRGSSLERGRVTVKGTQKEGKERGERPGPGAEVRRKRGSTQNMVVSYLVLMVRLDSLGSTSHVALLWD